MSMNLKSLLTSLMMNHCLKAHLLIYQIRQHSRIVWCSNTLKLRNSIGNSTSQGTQANKGLTVAINTKSKAQNATTQCYNLNWLAQAILFGVSKCMVLPNTRCQSTICPWDDAESEYKAKDNYITRTINNQLGCCNSASIWCCQRWVFLTNVYIPQFRASYKECQNCQIPYYRTSWWCLR